jgi:hypothetical protein
MTMPPEFFDFLLDGPFEMRSRPEPLPGDLRRAWGIAVIVLVLGSSRGKQASLQKLHFMAHSLRTMETRQEARRVFVGDLPPSDLIVRVEPWVNRAISFAKGAGLLELKKGRSAKLTQAGLDMWKVLSDTKTILVDEKEFLAAVAASATEGAVEKIMRMELML